MTDQPMTGRAAMMLNHDENRLEARDRALAASVARQMLERYFDPERIEDMRDVREQIARAAEHAAYEAVKRERELHAGDMQALKAWSDVKWSEMMLAPKQPIVTKP